MPSRGTSTERSAGGVVLRGDDVCVIVPTRRAADGRRVLALPKGHPEGGESSEQAARREIREETGLEVDLVEPLGEVQYWYQRDGRRILKSVEFFVFRVTGGSFEDRDRFEVEEARWMPLADAPGALSYRGERDMAARALARRRASRANG